MIEGNIKPGDEVWAITKQETEDVDLEGYIFMAECMGYALLVGKYAHCEDFKQQVEEMAEEAETDGMLMDIVMIPMSRVHTNRQDAEEHLQDIRSTADALRSAITDECGPYVGTSAT